MDDYVYRLQILLSMTDPPYLTPVARNGHKYDNGKAKAYMVARPIKKITPDELVGAINKKFPAGATREKAADYRHYQQAAVVLGRYLVYEMTDNGSPIWRPQDLVRLREYAPSVRTEYNEINIIEPEVFDKFLSWVKGLDGFHCHAGQSPREIHDAMYVMRWLGLRWNEMRDVRVDIYSGKVKLSRGHLSVDGKMHKRDFDVPEFIIKFLNERQAYVRKNFPKSERLFCNSHGDPWGHGGPFTRVARRLWTRYSREVLGKEPDAVDLEAIHPHALRHLCGTFMVQKGIPLPVVKEYLGHRSYRILDIYVRHVNKSSRSLIENAFNGYGGMN